MYKKATYVYQKATYAYQQPINITLVLKVRDIVRELY